MEIVKKEINMGPGPILGGIWRFSILPEPLLSTELARLAGATANVSGDTDVVSLQPCLTETARSQDRYVIKDLELTNGTWRLRAIFDGHAGHATVDHVVQVLPSILEDKLRDGLENPTPEDISRILRETITSVDDGIKQEFLQLFPDVGSITKMAEEDIRAMLDGKAPTSARAQRALSGTTVLVALTDPGKVNLWVASLGDCQAALGIKSPSDDTWQTTVLSADHNGTDASETERIRKEHPGELDCMLSNRVLGVIAVTRALGDFMFKLPREYTERIFIHLIENPDSKARVLNYIERNITPPYLSNVAEVRHVHLGAQKSTTFLVLCSDGLVDLYEEPHPEPLPGTTIAFPNDRGVDLAEASKIWMSQVEQGLTEDTGNLALFLLKQAMGGRDGDTENICKLLTAERPNRWMDDTTILVQRLE